jgi:hypothetical protein
VSDQLFVVRMWYEASGAQPGQWRGSIMHVGSGARWYFAELGELNDFIRIRLAPGDATATATR